MTLQQLKYILKVAEKGSINEAAKELFISQPSLSNAIKELEKELQFAIFIRNNRGVVLTNKGSEFLGYAQQVLTQADLLEAKFITGPNTRHRFCASSQHYLFVANAFVELVKEYDSGEYDFTLNETTTYEVIEDVKTMYSEIGIIYLSNYNEAVIRKMLSENNLTFTEIFCAKPHVFLYKNHPLASKESIDIKDLEEFPRISFNQGQHNSFYYSEEILSSIPVKKNIHVSDRAAVVNFLVGLNAYTFSSGIFPKYLHGENVISVPINYDEKIQIGVIMHKDVVLSDIGKKFYDTLFEDISKFQI